MIVDALPKASTSHYKPKKSSKAKKNEFIDV